MDHQLSSVTLLKDKRRLSPEAFAREGATDVFSSHKLKKQNKKHASVFVQLQNAKHISCLHSYAL